MTAYNSQFYTAKYGTSQNIYQKADNDLEVGLKAVVKHYPMFFPRPFDKNSVI